VDVEQLNHALDGSPLHRFRCSACSYGASCRNAPERCPMCGGSTWEHEGWRPFGARIDLEAADRALYRDPAS
jgi:hypothetical protein